MGTSDALKKVYKDNNEDIESFLRLEFIEDLKQNKIGNNNHKFKVLHHRKMSGK